MTAPRLLRIASLHPLSHGGVLVIAGAVLAVAGLHQGLPQGSRLFVNNLHMHTWQLALGMQAAAPPKSLSRSLAAPLLETARAGNPGSNPLLEDRSMQPPRERKQGWCGLSTAAERPEDWRFSGSVPSS